MSNEQETRKEEKQEYEHKESYSFSYETFSELFGDVKEALFNIVFMK
ncbi:hypothetical protein [Ruminococcus sp. HUN007]|nr:hypothetical protein [Ruminococcus sp. HUN007]